ncbi:MAG TPA: hypothetical protein VH333_18110 [Pseudonocardiaceae bacterium]|nr:hypothetical protein [Pseudonocardiaceae bacterium]
MPVNVPVTLPSRPPDEPVPDGEVVDPAGGAVEPDEVEVDVEVSGAGVLLASGVVDVGVDDVLWTVTTGADGLTAVTPPPVERFGWLVTPWPPFWTTWGCVVLATPLCEAELAADEEADETAG